LELIEQRVSGIFIFEVLEFSLKALRDVLVA